MAATEPLARLGQRPLHEGAGIGPAGQALQSFTQPGDNGAVTGGIAGAADEDNIDLVDQRAFGLAGEWYDGGLGHDSQG